MNTIKIAIAGAALAAGFGLSGCVDDGYGYGGVGVGYDAAYDPYYGGFSADPYWGWEGDYYYPGSGYYVYDRDYRRHRWTGAQQHYWQGRGQAWHGRQTRPMWRDYGSHATPSAAARAPGGANFHGGGHGGGHHH
jgi:hypothetical protein